MAHLTEEKEFCVRRCLADAGCCAELIDRFLALEQQAERRAQYRLLARHRAALLDALHQAQYKIDCLDYLVYTMKQEDGACR